MILFISVTGIAVMSFTGVSAHNSAIERAKFNQLYAADGGIETGLQSLVSDSTNQYCQAVSTSTWQGVATVTINGKPVAVTCRTTAGGTTTTSTTTGGPSSLLAGYTLVLGTGGLTMGGNNQNGNTPFEVRGNIYSGALIDTKAAAPLTLKPTGAAPADGNLDYALTCSPLPPNVTITSPGKCTKVASAPSITQPTVVIPTALAPAQVSIGKCNILYPGKYTSDPAFNPSRDYYLASGTYYFEGTGDVNLKGNIFGGAPGAETKQNTVVSPCATDADAATSNPSFDASKAGSGVTIILGGNATIRGQNNTEVEFYSRMPNAGSPDAGTSRGLGVWALTANPPTNYLAVTNSSPFMTQDKTATIVVHGVTYLPKSLVNIREPINPDAPGAALFMGGLDALGLTVDMQGNGRSSEVAEMAGSVQTTTQAATDTPRTTLICSTASPNPPGGSPTLIEAATLPDSPDATQLIQAWRQVTVC